jgi:hypothetical protein
VLNTPVDRIRCSLVGELRVPARVSSLSVLPSPLPGRVGVHITTFEACSSFTRVTACRVAHLPYVGFVARLRPGRLPGSDARQLPSSTNNLLGWVLPPLVICAVEAHPITPFNRPKSAHSTAMPPRSGSCSSGPFCTSRVRTSRTFWAYSGPYLQGLDNPVVVECSQVRQIERKEEMRSCPATTGD